MKPTNTTSLSDAYRARVDLLEEELRERGRATTPELANALRWSSHEVRGKLIVLKNQGRVCANGRGEWRAA